MIYDVVRHAMLCNFSCGRNIRVYCSDQTPVRSPSLGDSSLFCAVYCMGCGTLAAYLGIARPILARDGKQDATQRDA